ncbi:hypothetical protein DL98DRAFT_520517 [Cadophora sp. DSE1049]|nr:hypothetical protein DL98DRAFT_520517 [Cadophora sp. DSE1049]
MPKVLLSCFAGDLVQLGGKLGKQGEPIHPCSYLDFIISVRESRGASRSSTEGKVFAACQGCHPPLLALTVVPVGVDALSSGAAGQHFNPQGSTKFSEAFARQGFGSLRVEVPGKQQASQRSQARPGKPVRNSSLTNGWDGWADGWKGRDGSRCRSLFWKAC